jgi:hypothetical protein
LNKSLRHLAQCQAQFLPHLTHRAGVVTLTHIQVPRGGGIPRPREAILEHRSLLQEQFPVPVEHQHMHRPMFQRETMDLAPGLLPDDLVGFVHHVKNLFAHSSLLPLAVSDSVNAAHCSTLNFSALTPFSNPSSRNAGPTLPPANPAATVSTASCAVAKIRASTIRTKSSIPRGAAGEAPRRTRVTQAESTSGTGKKQLAGTLNQPRPRSSIPPIPKAIRNCRLPPWPPAARSPRVAASPPSSPGPFGFRPSSTRIGDPTE